MRQTRLRATRIGPFAARALRAGVSGRVHSVFRRSAYLSIQDQLICLGPSELGDGPLNLLCQPWRCAWSTDLQPHEPVRVESQVLYVGHSLSVYLAAAEVWAPKPIPEWGQSQLRLGLAALAQALPEVSNHQGLVCLLHAGSAGLDDVSPLEAAPRRAAADLGRFVARAMTEGADGAEAVPIASLVGLGPGLTPSGDDFLGGVLVALSLLGGNALRDRLWQAAQPHIAALTNDISAAHLAAAGAGFGSGALHELIHAVLAGAAESIPRNLEAVARIGHSSGLDALAGTALVLRAASA